MSDKPTLLGLGKVHLDLKPFISPDACCYALTGLRVDLGKREAIATDGKLLIVLPLAEIDAGSVPAISGMGDPLDQPVTLPVAALEKAFRLVPGKAAIPALENVFLSKGEYPRVKLSATDLDVGGTVEARVVEGEYPDIEDIMKRAEKRPLKIVIDAHLLARLAAFALKHADGRLAGISFYLHPRKPNESIRFEFALKSGGMARGVLMPIKQVAETAKPPAPEVASPEQPQTDQPSTLTVPETGGRGEGVSSESSATVQPAGETAHVQCAGSTVPEPPQASTTASGPVPPAFIEPTRAAESGRPDEAKPDEKAPATGEKPPTGEEAA
jgi:hypothetical protein